MRPITPRFCKVVVVIGVGVATGVAGGSGVVSCASRPEAVANDGKNDGLTNHRRVKDEKVALSIDHEIHFREPDSGTFGHFCHR